MKYIANTITIATLAVATVGLTVSTVLLAINSSGKSAQIDQLTAQVENYENEVKEKDERIKLVGTATCLMEGYETTNTVRNNSCKSIVNFIISEKTNADIKDWLGY